VSSKSQPSGTRKRAAVSRVRHAAESLRRNASSRILIVDDHGFYANGLTTLINNEPDIVVCGICSRLGNVAASIEETEPNLVILDVSVAGENSVELAKVLQLRRPGLKFMFLSSFPGGLVHWHAKDLKPNTVVEKTQDPISILRAIRRAIKD
jgi:DNA-binding NarL/FixJ family response regulator